MTKKILLLALYSTSAFATTRYVNLDNLRPVAPYTSWETSANEIQTAVDASVDGDTVLVADGLYVLGSEISVTNTIAIQSLNGGDVTIVDGAGAHRCFNLGDSGSTISDFTFTNGYSTANGGGVYSSDTNSMISNCFFIHNSAKNGGGLSSGTAINCFLSANTVYGNGSGGGMYEGIANNCTFTNNFAYRGGGMSDGTANDCLFIDNFADREVFHDLYGGYGGGMYQGKANRCAFIGNSTRNHNGSRYGDAGGGMYDGIANDCLFTNNNAHFGGGMEKGLAENCEFVDNSAILGGGMCFGTVSNSFFTANTASSDGGGMWRCTANKCVIFKNSASGGGGGVFAGTVNNSLIIHNSAVGGGGGMAGDHSYYLTANNCTIYGNQAQYGGGISQAKAYNCIIWGNHANTSSKDLANMTTSYCCSPSLIAGENGNITNNPVFVSLGHIATNSLCRNAGSDLYAAGVDIDGESWLTPPSIGCDELAGTGVTGEISLNLYPVAELVPGKILAGTLGSISGDIFGPVTHHILDFGDGITETNTLFKSPAHTWNNPGEYTVVLTAFNDTYPYGVSSTQMVQVLDPVDARIYVAATGDDSNDGHSWATAKATIQAGVDAQRFINGIVLITNGTYVLDGEIVVDRDMIIQSVNGPDNTIVDGNQKGTCFNLGNHAVTISGLTIQNGIGVYGSFVGTKTYRGGGIYCTGTNPIVTNCVIRNNTSGRDGGGMYFGTADNCSFVSNSVGVYGGGKAEGIANNCSFLNNTAPFGGGMNSGTANNCFFSGNASVTSGNGGGGGMNRGTANNCSFTKNTATYYGGAIANSTANNCGVFGNSAGTFGGGISGGTANNCTVTGNSANNAGGGIYKGAVNNCIVWYNQAVDSGDDLSDDVITRNCCSSDVQHGEDGNITNAPLLATSLHLTAESPCIGKGDPAYATEKDIDGQVWGDLPCIGCDEYGTIAIGAIESRIDLPEQVAAGVSVPVVSSIWGGAAYLSVLEYGDGTSISNRPGLSRHSWESSGVYSLVLTAFNLDYPEGFSITQQVEVVGVDAVTWHVSLGGDDANDGLSWVTPKRTIQAAVNAAGEAEGSRVLVANGTYYPSSEIVVANTITIESINGPSLTIVDGSRSHRCFNLGNSSCTISGFTIRNGYYGYADGGGIYCSGNAPMVSNCVFSSNRAYEYSRDGGGMYMGTAINCSFVGNKARNGGGMAEGTAINCSFIENTTPEGNGGGMHNGTANNCFFFENSARRNGGGMNYGTANNCTFVGNVSSQSGGGISGIAAINCILYGNAGGESSGGSTINCWTSDPHFMNAAIGNYRLRASSPCIDAGDNASALTDMDLDGNNRMIHGTVDIGAYEYAGFINDADGDTFTDYEEYVSDTDSSDSNEWFHVSAISNGTIFFDSSSDRLYTLLWRSNLVKGVWINAPGESRMGNGGEDSMELTNGLPQGFYKVQVELPE